MNDKHFFILIFVLFITQMSFAQGQEHHIIEKKSRWEHRVSLEWGFNKRKSVIYSRKGERYINPDFGSTRGVVGLINYSASYAVTPKFSVGAVSGFSTYAVANIYSLRLGGVFRLTPVPAYRSSIYFQTHMHIPINGRIAADLGDARIGVEIPLSGKHRRLQWELGVFTSFVSFSMKESLFGGDEDPDTLRMRNNGVSIGIRF